MEMMGAMMFNLVYWNFGFLRMSTSGMTAQTCGSGDFKESAKLLGESTALAALISAIIIVLQWPIRLLLLWIIGPSPEVTSLANTYFNICIWGVPPVLVMMAFDNPVGTWTIASLAIIIPLIIGGWYLCRGRINEIAEARLRNEQPANQP